MKTLIRREKHWNGMETRWYYNSSDKKLHVVRLQDVEPQLEANQQAYNKHTDWKAGRYKESAGLHKVASIPPALIEKWMKEGFNFLQASNEEIRRKLNDPDYRKLRTSPGRL